MYEARDVQAALDGLSRELSIVVDREGLVRWADARAQRAGIVEGTNLVERVVPGTEDKARELCRRAVADPVERWELPLVIDNRPVTMSFAGRPLGDGHGVLLGSHAPQDYADAAAEGGRAYHEIVDLNRQLARKKLELEEAHRGVLALHAELEQQADRLRSSNEVKSRLVAGVSHEFRTPLHSILGLSRLLLAGADGPLTTEQRTQVDFIRNSAEELSTMINDMLDLSKLDAGSAPIRSEHFELAEFMSALRGTMAPLVPEHGRVEMVFDPAPDVPLEQDQGKLGQIVRNLVSNALKFTERGVVRIGSKVDEDALVVVVQDTGIGIAAEDQARVFEEFTQIEGPLQRGGTGLGLPLARKLAQLLGGRLELTSWVGVGSTFTLTIPLEHPELGKFRQLEVAASTRDPDRAPVLVVEDDRSAVFVYERYLSMAGFQVLPARTTAAARDVLKRVRPSAILLDVMLDGEDTWSFLAELKRSPDTHDIPVLVCTVMNRESRARALGADEFWLKPVDQDKLLRKLQTLAVPGGAKVLVVDDDATYRYLMRKHLLGTPYRISEAADGPTAVRLARDERPHVILLDFLLEDMTAFDVIDQLKSDPRTRMIPVIIVTSHALPLEDRERLGAYADAILSKEHLSRELAINRIRDALSSAGIRQRLEPTGEP